MCIDRVKARYKVDMVVFWIVVQWKRILCHPMPFWALGMAHRREAVEVELHRSSETEKRHRTSGADISVFKEGLFRNGDHFTFRRNDFPYHLEDGVKHFVLWINPEVKLKTRQADFIIDNHLIALGYRNPCQRVFYKNSITIKSIKEIDHIHVFVRDYSRATANNASNSGQVEQMSSW